MLYSCFYYFVHYFVGLHPYAFQIAVLNTFYKTSTSLKVVSRKQWVSYPFREEYFFSQTNYKYEIINTKTLICLVNVLNLQSN